MASSQTGTNDAQLFAQSAHAPDQTDHRPQRLHGTSPLPADQPRWDVYSKLGTENQRFLWGILEDAAKPASRSANQQKIGDFFASCMDEAAVERAGAAPLKPDLDAIAALKTVADLPPLLGRFHMAQSGALFDFGSNQDFADSSQVIAFAAAGG